MKRLLPVLLLAACAWGHAPPVAAQQGGRAQVLRAAELRADKLPVAPVVAPLALGESVRVLSIEGGWVWVETEGQPPRRGWLRASAINLAARASVVAGLASGRQAGGNVAMTLGVRSLAPRASRHALIIGVSQYADPNISSLPGAKIDKESATQMAEAMQVPLGNIRYLQDQQATGDAIRQAVRELDAKVQEGDRVFIHFSGHGTRYLDAQAGGCVEALLAHDGGTSGTITNREMASLLAPITRKTDKLFVMYDACHSGGVIAQDPGSRTRGILLPTDEGRLRGKFSSTNDECGRPVNVKTRNLLVEATDRGTLPQDIIHLSSSRDNEISFDDEYKGGLATQFMRDCMLRDARDLDNSGAISIDEVRVCAQEKIENRMRNDANFKPHHLVLTGNIGFVPAWFGKEDILAAAAPLAAAPALVPAPAAPAPVTAQPGAAPPPPPPVASSPPPPPLTGAQALEQMFAQRDAKRAVRVTTSSQRLRIGQDPLDFAVQSDRPGYVYVAMAGSDNKTLQLLFPNELDRDNRIEPGRPLALPRPSWRVRAGGPEGTNQLLVLVADSPRDLAPLQANKAGPFVLSLNDAAGRATLGALLASDAFGAALFQIDEVR